MSGESSAAMGSRAGLTPFQSLITAITSDLVRLEGAALDEGIGGALRAIGELTGSDRAYIFRFSPDGRLASNTHEWCAPGVSSHAARLQELDFDEHLPYFARRIRNLEAVYVPHRRELPPEARSEREELELEQIESLLIVPMVDRGRVAGFVGFDAVRKKKEWPPETIALLYIVGTTINNALERRESERALRISEERFRALVENARDWIWEVDASLRYTYVASRSREIFGREPDEFLGRSPYELMRDEEAERVRAQVAPLVAAARPIVGLENRMLHRDGHEIILETNGTPVVEDDGTLIGYRGIDRDITERRRIEEERRTLEARLLQLQKLESLWVLAGGVAHDFDNLLTGILGSAGAALQALPHEPAARENVLLIQQAAARATDLVRQMLVFAGRAPFEPRAIDLTRVAREIGPLLEASTRRCCRLDYDLAENLPIVAGDPAQLQQVVLNLVLNAAEAIGERPGRVALRSGSCECDRSCLASAFVDENLPEGPYVYLEVEDNGSGIPREILPRIFDPFFTTKLEGRGLGLAATLGIVRAHGGAIQVESEPGRGARFRVLLPVGRGVERLARLEPIGREPQAAPPRGESSAASLQAKIEPPLSGTVLVVDDDNIVRRVARAMLEQAGLPALTAASGEQALELLRANQREVSVVLLDMTMPQMSGEETFRALRSVRPDLPVVLSSGYSEQDASARFGARGLAGFIRKPYSAKHLLEALRQVAAAAKGS